MKINMLPQFIHIRMYVCLLYIRCIQCSIRCMLSLFVFFSIASPEMVTCSIFSLFFITHQDNYVCVCVCACVCIGMYICIHLESVCSFNRNTTNCAGAHAHILYSREMCV